MHGFKALLCTTALLAPLALVSPANAQISINIGVPPVCSYGYYDYSPYACAPMGYYGPGYFYNGIFLGMGPWAGWGYHHGWGSHRFSNSGGGSYNGGFHGDAYNHGREGRPAAVRTSSRGGSYAKPSAYSSHATAARGNASHGASHATTARGSASHATASRGGGASHAAASHGGGGRAKK